MVSQNETLVEFHVVNGRDTLSHLREPKTLRPFDTALCKSFDLALPKAAKSLSGVVSEAAFLFRKRNQVSLTTPEGFRVVKATPRDLEDACKVGCDFFSSGEEVEHLLQSEDLWIARCRSEIVGCNVTYALEGPFNAVDVGIVVRKGRRNEGFGTVIVSAQSDAVEHIGGVPICGCAKGNIASKTALERAGFVSEHRLLRIEFPA